jgi:hypothetical protein
LRHARKAFFRSEGGLIDQVKQAAFTEFLQKLTDYADH